MNLIEGKLRKGKQINKRKMLNIQLRKIKEKEGKFILNNCQKYSQLFWDTKPQKRERKSG